eukprot:2989304-Amphidinium_carterae.1
MAATLIIAGLEKEASVILEAFQWGDEFLRLNGEFFTAYASAASAAEVKQKERALLADREAARELRRLDSMDLPPSDYSTDEEDGEEDGVDNPPPQTHFKNVSKKCLNECVQNASELHGSQHGAETEEGLACSETADNAAGRKSFMELFGLVGDEDVLQNQRGTGSAESPRIRSASYEGRRTDVTVSSWHEVSLAGVCI